MAISQLLRKIVITSIVTQEWFKTGITYNPFRQSVYDNPYPLYDALRQKDPVHWSSIMGAWFLTRYDDINKILRNHKQFSSDIRNRNENKTQFNTDNPSLLRLDPPDHTRLRALVNKTFTSKVIAMLEDRVRSTTKKLLDGVAEKRDFDLLNTIAYPLPVIVMAELLGVPPNDYAQFKIWSDQRSRLFEPTITSEEKLVGRKAGEEFDRYFEVIVNSRRQSPQNDLISLLIEAEEKDDKLSNREILTMLQLLLVAGNETTTNLMGNGILALIQNPEQYQALRNNRTLVPNAIEELIRFDTPVQLMGRTITEEMTFSNRRFKKGQAVILSLGAANRDPEIFTEPHKLDLNRECSAHLGFGRGIHFCLGAFLARLEFRVVLEELQNRYKEVSLLNNHIQFKDHIVLRGLKTLPVRVTR